MICENNDSKVAAIYARVSSKKQDLRSQLPDLDRWAENYGGRVKKYQDKVTGTKMDRPGWNKLWKEVQMGRVHSIVVWRLDRLGRTAAGLTQLFEDLRRHKVNLVSLKDGLDLNTTAGRLLANVLASVAQFESEVRGERVMAGQAAARAQGKRWGGSKPGRRLKLTDQHVKVIHRMRLEDATIKEICDVVNLSKPTVRKVLRDIPWSTSLP